MNGRNSYLVVGIFVSIGLVTLIVMILSFAGGRSSEPNMRYTILFERDISGLTLGAPVRYLGVAVGQVVDMKLTTRDGTRVRVDLEVLQSTPISTATYASLAFQGVTGVAFISLAADELGETSNLVAGEFEHPVIPARDVGLAALLSEAPEISHQLALLLDRASRLLDEDNSAAFSRTLANIEKISASLAGDQAGIASLPGQLQATLGEIERTFSQVRNVLDQVEPDILATLSQLHHASSNIAEISKRLDGWLADNDRDMNEFISGGLGQTAALIADTRNTMRELEKLLVELRQVPSQFIYKPQSEPIVVDP